MATSALGGLSRWLGLETVQRLSHDPFLTAGQAKRRC